MKIYFCREGLARIMDWLQQEQDYSGDQVPDGRYS